MSDRSLLNVSLHKGSAGFRGLVLSARNRGESRRPGFIVGLALAALYNKFTGFPLNPFGNESQWAGELTCNHSDSSFDRDSDVT